MSDIINTAQVTTAHRATVKRKGPASRFAPIKYVPPKPKYNVNIIATFAEARERAKKVVSGVWTPDKVEELKRLIAGGECLVDLGEHFGTTPEAVRGACYRNTIKPPAYRKARKKYEHHDEKKDKIIEMMDAGMMPKEIAGELDMLVSAVYQIMYMERKRRRNEGISED